MEGMRHGLSLPPPSICQDSQLACPGASLSNANKIVFEFPLDPFLNSCIDKTRNLKGGNPDFPGDNVSHQRNRS